MNIIGIILIGIGLAMDAFAVSVCKGLAIKKINYKKIIKISIYFSIFQTLMPVIGYCLGTSFSNIIERVDHWVSFGVLSIIGLNMIKESFEEDEEKNNDKIDTKTMLLLSIATSIDAMAVGVTFAFLKINIVKAGLIIGIITFILCFIGVIIGNKFGDKLNNKAGVIGGIILVLNGLKILIEHLKVG